MATVTPLVCVDQLCCTRAASGLPQGRTTEQVPIAGRKTDQAGLSSNVREAVYRF
jgi:hypothetical protein